MVEGRADYNGFFEGPWPLFTCVSFISASSTAPPGSHHTLNTAFLLPSRGGGSSLYVPPSQAKGTSPLLLLPALRKCRYCSAYTGVSLKCERGYWNVGQVKDRM